jgi:superfamily I DNA and RNA helicase
MLIEKEKNKELDIQKDESSVKMVPISNKDQEFIALSLDDDEIRFINNTKPGHWLTLANPGTGKSVILLSKAYRLVSMNPESKVLITCYNDNLCTHHTIFKERTGLNSHGLYVKKFFKMVFDLLKDYKIPTIGLENLKNNENKYDLAIKYLYDYVSEPEYKPIFDAIFIDEVQLFKPIWILTLKLMLKKGGYFELYGDLNQNVRTSNNGLKTPWKDKSLNLNWQGHTRYLTKNYRNTKNNNNKLTKLIEKINNNVKKYKPDFELEDTKLASISSRNNKRRVYIPRSDEAGMPKKVIHMIEEAHEKWHASYDDIAIIFPVSHYDNYQPFEKIKKLLENKGIENCQIFGEKDVKSRLNDTNGIIFSTIESSLGLDFNIVIVCGTAYWKNYWTKSSYKPQILTQEKLESGDNDAITAYCDYGRKLYSACSRARNGLIIVDDLPNDSPMRLLIKKEVE